MKRILLFVLFAAVCMLPRLGLAQGATTASITGVITDNTGGTLPGANVVAVHEPSGTKYGTVSRSDGRYTIPNMRTGGPYTISVSFVGYGPQQRQGVSLALGQELNANFQLVEAADQLAEVVITTAVDPTFNSGRTGAATNISREQIQSLPTISRSLGDFTRLTPQANGNNFGGMNNRFNNITIDGAVINDVFGASRDASTPGAGAGAQPISLDAVQEIQVVLAPYDVTLGNFTGGGVNAITRSGTNDFTGSVYYFGRNENIIGKHVETNERAAEFTDRQYGVRVGGPIIQNKLFFFVNADYARRAAPLTFNAGEPGSVITVEQAQQLRNYLIDTYNYDPGGFGGTSLRTESSRLFGRLDWNIAQGHQLTLRHNFVDAFDDNISRSASLFRFGNNAYQNNSKTNSSVLELKSQFSNRFSNKLIIGYTRIRENRETLGRLFPQVTINNVGGSNRSVEFGSQRSSTANELDQDIFELTNDFKIYAGQHTFTVGTHNEFFKFRNLFINNLYGQWEFNSLQEFYDDIPNRVQATYALNANDPRPAARFNAMQLGFYVQDEWAINRQLNLTFGLRADVPIIPDTPPANDVFAAAFPGQRTDQTPSGQLLWAPRLGFNYDVTGNRSIQLRGGSGVFTGRVPFVWLSNQYSNAGLLLGTIDVTGAELINGGNGFQPDPEKQGEVGPRTVASTYEINAISDEFKIPQVWRNNLAVDFQLPAGIVATLEGIYSKTLNSINYQDINLKAPSGTLATGLSGGNDNREIYPLGNTNGTPNRRINETFTNVIYLENTNKGYTYNLTGQLRKDFGFGLQSMIAYTYGQAKDVNSGTSSTARSNWQFVQMVNGPNNPPLAYSTFDLRHRIVGSLGYKIEYAKNFSTTVALFYAGRSGNPFTYLYRGDLNNDGGNQNDLLYVPRTRDEIKLVPITDRDGNVTATVEQQWTALDAYIENDDYLRTRRGQYTERNAARSPWQHQFDLRLMQDLFTNIAGRRNTLQITLDIFNVGNLLKQEWGRAYLVPNDAVTLVTYDDNVGRRLAGNDGFQFNPSTNQTQR